MNGEGDFEEEKALERPREDAVRPRLKAESETTLVAIITDNAARQTVINNEQKSKKENTFSSQRFKRGGEGFGTLELRTNFQIWTSFVCVFFAFNSFTCA